MTFTGGPAPGVIHWCGPDRVSPEQMQKVKVLRQGVAGMASNSPAFTFTLRKADQHGTAQVTRLNHPAPMATVDLVYTWNPALKGYILAKDWGTGIIYVYSLLGQELKKIETGLVCAITSADKDKIFQYCYTDWETVSYYCKHDYAGNLLYGNTFPAGQINAADGYGEYDLLTGWSDPPGPFVDSTKLPNTQYNWLYKNGVLVGTASFDSWGNPTSGHIHMVGASCVTEDGVFLGIDVRTWSGGAYDAWDRHIQRYDFEMSLVSEVVPPRSQLPSGWYPLTVRSNNFYTVLQYNDAEEPVDRVKTARLNKDESPPFIEPPFITGPLDPLNEHLYFAHALGLIDYDYYVWWFDGTGGTEGIKVFDITSGSLKREISLPPCDWITYGTPPFSWGEPYRTVSFVIKEAKTGG